MTDSTCLAPGCDTPSPFLCSVHWKAVRPVTRAAFMRERARWQEHGGSEPPPRYVAVRALVTAEVLLHEKNTVSASIHLNRAEEHRRQAMAAGIGDPLEGLGDL